MDFVDDSLLGRLQLQATERPNKVAFTFVNGDDETESVTFRDLQRRVDRIAVRSRRFAEPGARVLLLYPSSIAFIEAFLGCLRAGLVAVPAYPPETGALKANLPRLKCIVEDCSPSLALASTRIFARKAAISETLPAVREMTWLATEEDDDLSNTPPAFAPSSGDEAAFLQYTSGSTANPKGVVVSHKNIAANHRFIADRCGLTDQDVCVGWLPLYHDMGLIGNVLQTIYSGLSCVWMAPLRFLQRPIRWLAAISQYRGTFSGGPNFAYDLCSKIPREQCADLDLSAWRIAFNGSEALRPDTFRRFDERFAPHGFDRRAFFPCYGLAESTLMLSGELTGERSWPAVKRIDKRKYESGLVVETNDENGSSISLVGSGRCDPAARVEIVNPDTGEPSKPDEVGEIWVASKSVAHGYWNQPDLSARVFRARLGARDDSTFLRTGDLGFFSEGQLFISGRLKDLIIVRGRKFHPEDIELTVQSCDDALRVGSIAAFGFVAEEEERLGVVAAVAPQLTRPFRDLIGAVRERITEVHQIQPHAITLIRPGRFPKTSSGKVKRHACRDGFFAGTLHPVAEWTSSSLRAQVPLQTNSEKT